MRNYYFLLLLLTFSGCAQESITVDSRSRIEDYYEEKSRDKEKSISHGTVSDGSLEHGKLVPYYGDNYSYFDTASYFAGRAYLHEDVLNIALGAYQKLENTTDRFFRIMECSNEKGGRLYPHRTHQNGTSIDFMMPLKKEGDIYYDLDTIGASHYWLTFDDNGKYSEDNSVEIDFEMMAQHILELESEARKKGWRIKKVILKIELKDELYATPSGKKIKEKGIYVVQGLSKLINALHDEHYHIDFEKM